MPRKIGHQKVANAAFSKLFKPPRSLPLNLIQYGCKISKITCGSQLAASACRTTHCQSYITADLSGTFTSNKAQILNNLQTFELTN